MLSEHHSPPGRLMVSAACTLDEVAGAPKVCSSELRIRARVDGIAPADSEPQIQCARELCPVSNAPRGTIEITVQSELEG